MTWVAVAIAGSAVVSGYMGSKAADKAADAQKDASAAGIAEQQRQYNTSLQLLDPQRQMGYGALYDIANLYGYSLPAYQTANQVLGGAYGSGGQPLSIYQGSASQGLGAIPLVGGQLNNAVSAIDSVLGTSIGGQKKPQLSMQGNRLLFDGRMKGGKLYGGYIDLATGEVIVHKPGTSNKDETLSAQATAALRSGKTVDGGIWSRFNNAINALNSSGWKYQPPAAQQPGATPGQPSMLAGKGETQPGNMSRFFTSPDYEFRRGEGMRGIENAASARSAGGNTLRALSEYNSNLASGEYNNYLNRLFAIAGLNQTATSGAINAGTTMANNVGALQQAAGDARASGIMGAANSVTGAVNTGLNNYMLYQGGYFNRPPAYSGPTYTPAPGMGIMPLRG